MARLTNHAPEPPEPQSVPYRYAERMTVRDMLTALQTFPRDADLLAFEDGSEDYCERESMII